MKILVCTKVVFDEEEINLAAGANADCPLKISNFDLSAIECALKIKELAPESQIIGVYAGEKLNSKLSKDLLSRGLDELINIKCEAADSLAAASAVATYASGANADVIVCGAQSSDLFQGVFAPYLAGKLGCNFIGDVSAVNAAGASLELSASTSTNDLQLSASLPAVLSVNPEFFEPKIPGMKAILQAAKKPLSEQASDEKAKLDCLQIAPLKSKERAKKIFKADEIEAFKAELEKLI